MKRPPSIHRFGVPDASDMSPGVIFGVAVGALHLHFAGRFALRFPEIRPAKTISIGNRRNPSIGRSMIVMGETDDLDQIVAHGDVGGLVAKGYLVDHGRGRARSDLPNVRVRPLTAAGEERRIRRITKRAETAGRPVTTREGAFAARDPHEFEKAHGRDEEPAYVNVSSLSTKRKFPIFLGVFHGTEAELDDWKIDSYGLMTRRAEPNPGKANVPG